MPNIFLSAGKSTREEVDLRGENTSPFKSDPFKSVELAAAVGKKSGTSARGFSQIQNGWQAYNALASNPGQVAPAWVFIWRRVEPISRLGTVHTRRPSSRPSGVDRCWLSDGDSRAYIRAKGFLFFFFFIKRSQPKFAFERRRRPRIWKDLRVILKADLTPNAIQIFASSWGTCYVVYY